MCKFSLVNSITEKLTGSSWKRRFVIVNFGKFSHLLIWAERKTLLKSKEQKGVKENFTNLKFAWLTSLFRKMLLQPGNVEFRCTTLYRWVAACVSKLEEVAFTVCYVPNVMNVFSSKIFRNCAYNVKFSQYVTNLHLPDWRSDGRRYIFAAISPLTPT